MSKQPKLVSIFPYQIKDVNLFYHRNHPINLHPKSFQFKKYWDDFTRKCIEGNWVNDKGTWVYMMPKLFFYCNYTKITFDGGKDFKHPNLRDNDWILASYFLCLEGFSGFELDSEYTCNNLIKRFEQDKENKDKTKKRKLRDSEILEIPKSCIKEDGTYKKYIDPWEYLTKFYLLELKPNKPLGYAIYENPRNHGAILTARGVGKSAFTFVGDFLHEFLLNGIKRFEDLKNVNEKLLFGMGAADANAINKSLTNISTFYNRMPGQYRYSDTKLSKYMGPLFKRVQGVWSNKGEIKHVVKTKNGRNYIDSSNLYVNVLTPDKFTIGAGDRFRRIYIEEVGFVENALLVHSTNKDSLISQGEQIGSAIFTGTGGNMQKVKDIYKMFTNVDAYNIFGIPNYWENSNKKIGLFIPAHYANKKYKDENGNTRLEWIHEDLLETRERNMQTMDSVAYDADVSFNPMEPKEILKSNSNSLLPKKEAQDQLSKLDAFDIWKLRAQVGSLHYDQSALRGIRWDKDIEGKLRPILDMKEDGTAGFNKNGAVIIYEQPDEYVPQGLYYVVYDPAKKSGDGESYHSMLVYKNFSYGGGKTLYDTIVAEVLCRKETLPENYNECIKLAKYFNATIFPEINVAGFVEWCKTEGYYAMLEGDAYEIEMEINPEGKRSYYKVGCDMNNKRKKRFALQKLRDWLLEVKERDPVTNTPMIRTMDWIFSKRLLEEIANSEDGDNVDHISSMLVLMILILKIHKGEKPNLSEEEEEDAENSLRFDVPIPNRQPRAAFLIY